MLICICNNIDGTLFIVITKKSRGNLLSYKDEIFPKLKNYLIDFLFSLHCLDNIYIERENITEYNYIINMTNPALIDGFTDLAVIGVT